MRRRLYLTGISVTLFAALGALASCADPVEDALIESLGDEVSGVRPGPFHRAGQPCLACHYDAGPGPVFSLGGTVFASPKDDVGVSDVTVTITDALGKTRELTSNCVGNFYVPGQADLAYPLRAEVSCTFPDGTVRRSVMGTRIERDGSCAGCHRGDPSATSPGRVACAPAQPNPPFTPAACAGGGRG
ncbi:MAG: hypothetical protein U0414_03945 [Polyangiaceae bacterium]